MLPVIEWRLALIPCQGYHMLPLIELRLTLISYQDHHMLPPIESRLALIPYQDYHKLLLLTLAGLNNVVREITLSLHNLCAPPIQKGTRVLISL